MSKTFSCRELGGVCDETFSGNTFDQIMQNGARHMMADDAHKASIMDMEKRTGENKEQWMARMQREFDARAENE
ncbi:DUF1059 domain-containing protein [Candidatus Parcubacteria bacterium]|nr:MAG: DUF1059 domain-containing protein [Candidatus Parcubacteria bacterium]